MKNDETAQRRRLSRRTTAWLAIIASVMLLIGAGVRVFSPHDYPAGDQRNNPAFWIVVGVIALLFAVVVIVGSIRELRRGPSRGTDD
jgi:hypothetical protein